ncbi:S1 family peptidase [Hyalangium sp.]|uniref:S1 family peptidase n=1 Tax=Hyalangium sp. TaxID=2028555 RepID=UPI002D4C4F11|nr:trypsin-like serine protease [Hyalangium sp.]HYI01358.1 trypsin-like serine protease [Hyalangium sp.]
MLLILSIELMPLQEQEPEAQLPEDSQEPLSPCMSDSPCALEGEEEEMAAIAGGSECTPPGLEGVGAIVRRNQQIVCTGTLIADDTILTAAHCIEDEDPATLSFMLVADSKMAVRFPIASGIPHPRYTQTRRGSYDIALLHLREPVRGVSPVPYRKASLPVYFRGRLTFLGFGDADGATKRGSGLKRCLRLNVSRVNDFTFENDTPGHTTCYGDSGGPVLKYRDDDTWEIVGIITSGDSLCKRFGLSARVDVAAEWIAKTASPSRVAPRLLSSAPEADFGGKRLAQQEKPRSHP